MDILEILAKWFFLIFDGLGINLMLKKIGKVFDKRGKDDADLTRNSLVGPKISQI